MSRIGIKPITIPEGVDISLDEGQVVVKGAKGELNLSIPKEIEVKLEDNQVIVTRSRESRQTKAYHGLIRSLINNMVIGVSQGYTKKLELVGTGYRAKKQGDKIVITVGYSHPVEVVPPKGIDLTTEGDTAILVSGTDKQQVGQIAADIRAIRKPEPYKGKGIRYQGEQIRRKAGKAAKVGAQ